ncbi:tectonic-like complex member MKS1 [Littorina saxatilis]|uniref:Meckel syndrome type 1 protein n=1 Tax=Littorina saxatilis TaxID=31220 RepID=A0AAN9AIS4_9CAEN
MAELHEPDVGTAYYRTNDAIKNLQIRVSVRRVTSSTMVGGGGGGGEPGENGEVEMKSMNEVAKQDKEERVIKWQEKIFSQREVELYSKTETCDSILEQKYNEEVTAILAKGKKPINRIFSYVDHDPYSHQDETVHYMTTSPKEKPSVLAEKMAHVRCRRVGGRQLKEKELGIIPKMNIVELEPTEDMVSKSHIEAPPMQIMYIMADLSPREKSAEEQDEYVLCCLQVNANGVLCIRPDFNRGRKPYIIETITIGREVYEYTIEHSSKEMSRTEQDKELKMYREVYTRHRDFLNACVGQDFEIPQPDVLRLTIYGEMISAQGFDLDNLYLHFFVDLPKNWYADRQQQLAWVTQTCATKTIGRDEVAYFSFPFHFELYYKPSPGSSSDPNDLPKFPLILIEVLSVDTWHRFFHEGYTYIQIPAKPGAETSKRDCWRPMGNSVSSKLRQFFIGGTPELDDPTYMSVPSTFDGTHLSKFGFRTETTGSVTSRINVMLQSRAFMEKKANKRTLGSVMDQLGISVMQANITSVLDAFKRARLKMMQAREAATRELLKDVEKRK